MSEVSDLVASLPDSDASTPDVQKSNAAILSEFDDHPRVAAPQHHDAPVFTHPRAVPTKFQQAVQPAPEQSWGDTFSSALHNLPGSAAGVLEATGHAIMHPIETATNLGQLGKGAFSQATGALGVQQDPMQKSQDEGLLDALESHYKQTYGSKAGFKKALATDPASIAMDAATVLGGGSLAGARATGVAGKLASLAGKASAVLDPVQATLGLAKTVGKLPGSIVRGTQSAMSAAPYHALQLASKAGATSDPVLKDAFLSQYQGRVPQSQIANTAIDALQQLKTQNALKFAQTKEGIYAANPGTLGFNKIDNAVQGAQTAMNPAGIPSPSAFLPATKNALQEAESLVNHWKTDPRLQTMEHFDELRNGLGDILENNKNNSSVQKYVGGIYHAVRSTMKDVSDEYTNTLEATTEARRQIEDLQKTLGLGRNTAATATVARQLRQMKTSNGVDLLSQLATVKPELPYMLAGAALSPWRPGGLIGSLEGAAGGMGAGYMIANPAAIPAGLATAAGTAVMSSPKLAGASNYAAGKVGSTIGKAQPFGTAGYYGERAGEAGEPPSEPNTPIAASPDDIDAATRMVIGEAGNEPDMGKAAALQAFINRAKRSGHSLKDEIYKPNQSEAITSGATKKIDPNSPIYQKIKNEIVIPLLSGRMPNPIGDSTHFLNPDLQLKLGRKIPGFASGEGQRIGNHVFYSAAGGRIERASGGKVGHQHLVDRLMRLAQKAKRETDKSTQPLLNADDSSIAHALAVANRGI